MAARLCGSLFLGSAPAVAENDELLAYTTYTIDQGNLALGLLSIDYGILVSPTRRSSWL